jgi:hypothetical protein
MKERLKIYKAKMKKDHDKTRTTTRQGIANTSQGKTSFFYHR